jgi:hypothetical protein
MEYQIDSPMLLDGLQRELQLGWNKTIGRNDTSTSLYFMYSTFKPYHVEGYQEHGNVVLYDLLILQEKQFELKWNFDWYRQDFSQPR